MDKKNLSQILSGIFSPIGFKKKGNYWIKNGDEVTKMINLQKSQFSNRFYINYGYILESISLDGLMMHISNGLGSIDKDENTKIVKMLDLENMIADEIRTSELKNYIISKIVSDFQKINTEDDLLQELKKLKSLNAIPLIVKKHFNLT